MNISMWKLAWKFVTGGGTGVVDYLLTVLKNALDGLGAATRDKITAVLNLTMKILSIVKVARILIPVKWQLAYELTVEALTRLIASLQDLELTGAELTLVINGYNEAYAAWMSPDDGTCVDVAETRYGLLVARNHGA